jgi:hypothetical protein
MATVTLSLGERLGVASPPKVKLPAPAQRHVDFLRDLNACRTPQGTPMIDLRLAMLSDEHRDAYYLHCWRLHQEATERRRERQWEDRARRELEQVQAERDALLRERAEAWRRGDPLSGPAIQFVGENAGRIAFDEHGRQMM